MMIDPLYRIVSLVGLAISGIATMGVKAAFAKYCRIPKRPANPACYVPGFTVEWLLFAATA